MKMMNRRLFLRVFFVSGASFAFLKFKPPGGRLKVTYKLSPKSSNGPVFKSADAFFYHFYKGLDFPFHEEHFKSGKMSGLTNRLSSDGKSAFAQYTYKNRRAFQECDKDWRAKHPEETDPLKCSVVEVVRI